MVLAPLRRLARLGGVAAVVTATWAGWPAPARAADRGPVLSAFRMDVDGDGAIDADREVFDLVVLAGGADGTVRFFRVDADGTTPVLFSVVRVTGDVTSVVLDRDERLAYVSAGSRGLVMIDLAGPASIQPIDLDRDGVDDRVLGSLDTPASARGLALDLGRGLGHVADGDGGQVVAQLIPPRVRFTALLRDPLRGLPGDEESILESRRAFVSDDDVVVTVSVIAPGRLGLSLVADGVAGGGTGLDVSFEGGSSVAALQAGTTVHRARVPRDAGPALASFKVMASDARVLDALEWRLVEPDVAGLRANHVHVAPEAVTLDDGTPSVSLAVGVRFENGLVVNVTGRADVTYTSGNPVVAAADANGLVTAAAGGETDVVATYRGVTGASLISVNRPPVLMALESSSPGLTIRSPDDRPSAPIAARFSDGSLSPAAGLPGVAFASSDEGVLRIDAQGVLSPVQDGVAMVRATAGALSAEAPVAVDLRRPASIDTLALDVVPARFALDDLRAAVVAARVAGTGSLDGLDVRFSLAGPASLATSRRTGLSGLASLSLAGLSAAGDYTLEASVTDPASGQPRRASTAFTVDPAPADAEPNGTNDLAVPLRAGRTLVGRVVAGSDDQDVYRYDGGLSGELRVTLQLADGVPPSSVQLVLRRADGAELGRIVPSGPELVVPIDVDAGGVVVGVQALSGAADYTLTTAFVQGPLEIAQLSPPAGGPGTTVAIAGRGFSTRAGDTVVRFGTAHGKVIAVTPTLVTVQVPALAVDGPLTVVSGAREATVPNFSVGRAGPPPRPRIGTGPSELRVDPSTGQAIDIRRVFVALDPVAPRAVAEQLAQRFGGVVIGVLPRANQYILGFPDITSLDGLEARRRQLLADPGVVAATYAERATSTGVVPHDSRLRAGRYPGSRESRARFMQQIRLFEALDAIRSTPPFDDARNLREVRVAIIDSGFDPFQLNEFRDSAGNLVVRLRSLTPLGEFGDAPSPFDPTSHGTMVASVIAAVNNATEPVSGSTLSKVSSVLNGVFARNEQPVRVTLYGCPGLNRECVEGALEEVAASSFDVLNLSLTSNKRGYEDPDSYYFGPVKDMASRTLVLASANNYNVRNDFFTPARLAANPLTPNVMSVAAVAVGDFDTTGEDEDDRSIFRLTRLSLLDDDPADPPGLVRGQEILCDPATGVDKGPPGPDGVPGTPRNAASSCGPHVSITAPGERVLVHSQVGDSDTLAPCCRRDPPGGPPRAFSGTSAAAPIVAGVAALLQSIRSTPSPIPPDRLKEILQDTADEVTGTWVPTGRARRVNALAAARAALQQFVVQKVYVADGATSAGTGHLVGIPVDPLTGQPTSEQASVVPLSVETPSGPVALRDPRTLVMSPQGERLYAAVTSQAHGAGILAVNTLTLRAETFVPLSGTDLATGAGPGTAPITFTSTRPPLAITPDGRLLYVGVGPRVIVVNLVDRQVVKALADLPAPANLLAGDLPEQTLGARLDAFASAASSGDVVGRAGLEVASLEVAPDGRVLYAAIDTGGGGGRQPGFVIAVDIDLYRDADPATPGLEPDLTRFFELGSGRFRMAPPSGNSVVRAIQGDEPSDLAIDPGGRTLYMTHGGLDFFEAVPPDDFNIARFQALYQSAVVGVMGSAALGTSVMGLAVGIQLFEQMQATLVRDLLLELQQQARSGLTLLHAPGQTGVFTLPGSGGVDEARVSFPADVGFGWNPSPELGGRIVNQFRFADVFAKRPAGIALRPDGRRAIVSMFQTGNFAVLDQQTQTHFSSPALVGQATDPNAGLLGIVAVTPSLRLDRFLWPDRGAFEGNRGAFMPSPDETYLFPGPVEYAQNGRFAVGVHTGSKSPAPVTVTVPDWNDPASIGVRFALGRLGFNVVPGATSAIRPGGGSVSIGATFTEGRYGGGLTILHDDRITADLAGNALATETVPPFGPRPYYTVKPLCAGAGAEPATCANEVTTRLAGYQGGSGLVPFDRPRGVAIQTFVNIEAPRFGDHVRSSSKLQVTWRDPRVTHLRFVVEDLGPESAPLEQPALVRAVTIPMTPLELTSRSSGRSVKQVFGSATPEPRHRYRFTVEAQVPGDTLSATRIDVRFAE